jgi:hypothetical protein
MVTAQVPGARPRSGTRRAPPPTPTATPTLHQARRAANAFHHDTDDDYRDDFVLSLQRVVITATRASCSSENDDFRTSFFASPQRV